MKLIKIQDSISPDLVRRAAAVADKRRLLLAMGQAAKSIAIQAFTDPALRPTPWPARKSTKQDHPLLQKSTMLRKSLRGDRISGDSVLLTSDRPYAATHQLGSTKLNIPARPFFPFTKSGKITPAGKTRIERALRAALKKHGL